jgi:hypothetical protein
MKRGDKLGKCKVSKQKGKSKTNKGKKKPKG